MNTDDLLSAGIDFLGLTASRENVERGDTSEVAGILNEIVQTPGNRKIMHFCQSVAIAIDGYNDDPRELYQIPEARRYWQLLDKQFPYLFYFLSPNVDQRTLYALCHVDAVPGHGQASINSDEVMDFVVERLNYVAWFCWSIGDAPQSLIPEIAGHFGLGIDTGQFLGPLYAQFMAQRSSS